MTNTHIIKTDAGYGAVNGYPEALGDPVGLIAAMLRGAPKLGGAACSGHPEPDLWFANKTDIAARTEAARICAGCPVKAGCETFATESGQRHGVWGDVRFESSDDCPPPKNPKCRQGHRWTEDSTGWNVRGTSGKPYRYCKTCHADRQRRRRAS